MSTVFCVSDIHLGTFICNNSWRSLNHMRAVCISFSSNSSSRSLPAVHISWSIIFALTVKGASRPMESNSVAIFFRKFRFVYIMSTFGEFSLNVNTSLSALHHTPSILVHSIGPLSRSTSDFRSSGRISFSTTAKAVCIIPHHVVHKVPNRVSRPCKLI